MAERFGRPPAADPNLHNPAAVPVGRTAPPDDEYEDAEPTPATTPAPVPASRPTANLAAERAPIPTRGGQGTERIDSQVQKAQEQLLSLKRQQEQIERQKRELEELSRRQEDLENGRAEMVEKLTRALVVIERQAGEAAKRVEQLRHSSESLGSHLQALESINPKAWAAADLQKELNRSLGMVDHARTEYNQQKSRFATEGTEGDEKAGGAGGSYDQMFGAEPDHSFLYWLKAGVAFTLPLALIGLIALGIFIWRLVAGS